MKTLLVVIIAVLVAGAGGYFLGPTLIMRETAPLKKEIAQLQTRLQTVEEFVKAEEEARQRTSLKPDTGLPDVVRTVNRLAVEQKRIEDSIQRGFKDVDGRLAGIKASSEEGRNKLSRKIEGASKTADLHARETEFRSFIENTKARLLKIKVELLAKNVGVVKGELGLLAQSFEDAKKIVGEDGNKKAAIEKLQAMVKEIRAEIDTNLPAATDRIDLLWHELSKSSKSG